MNWDDDDSDRREALGCTFGLAIALACVIALVVVVMIAMGWRGPR